MVEGLTSIPAPDQGSACREIGSRDPAIVILRSAPASHSATPVAAVIIQTHTIPVTLAERPHPFPSRTRKLSSPAPKILRGQPFGKIGRRRDCCVNGHTVRSREIAKCGRARGRRPHGILGANDDHRRWDGCAGRDGAGTPSGTRPPHVRCGVRGVSVPPCRIGRMAERLCIPRSPLRGDQSTGPARDGEAAVPVPRNRPRSLCHISRRPGSGRRRLGRRASRWLRSVAGHPVDAAPAGTGPRSAGAARGIVPIWRTGVAGRAHGRRLPGPRCRTCRGPRCIRLTEPGGFRGFAGRGIGRGRGLAIGCGDSIALPIPRAVAHAPGESIGKSVRHPQPQRDARGRPDLHRKIRRHADRDRGEVRDKRCGDRRGQQHHQPASDPRRSGADHPLVPPRSGASIGRPGLTVSAGSCGSSWSGTRRRRPA